MSFLAGGTNGSVAFANPDGARNTNVWVRDYFHSALPMAFFHPELCKEAKISFTRWGAPFRARGRGLDRFPNADPLTNSSSHALAGVVLAAASYQSTGNRSSAASRRYVIGPTRATEPRSGTCGLPDLIARAAVECWA
jgi:hypothetical protein